MARRRILESCHAAIARPGPTPLGRRPRPMRRWVARWAGRGRRARPTATGWCVPCPVPKVARRTGARAVTTRSCRGSATWWRGRRPTVGTRTRRTTPAPTSAGTGIRTAGSPDTAVARGVARLADQPAGPLRRTRAASVTRAMARPEGCRVAEPKAPLRLVTRRSGAVAADQPGPLPLVARRRGPASARTGPHLGARPRRGGRVGGRGLFTGVRPGCVPRVPVVLGLAVAALVVAGLGRTGPA